MALPTVGELLQLDEHDLRLCVVAIDAEEDLYICVEEITGDLKALTFDENKNFAYLNFNLEEIFPAR